MDPRVNLADAGLALANVAYEWAKLPLHIAARLPGMGHVAAEGAHVRARLRSRLDGLVNDVLTAPEIERAVDRVIAGPLPDALVRSLIEHRVVEHLADELVASVDVETTVTTVLEHDTTQQLIAAVIASPGLDRVLVQATDRALRGPELQRVIEHVAASPEVREALQQQSTTLAQEMAQGLRSKAESLDEIAERTVHGWFRRPHPA